MGDLGEGEARAKSGRDEGPAALRAVLENRREFEALVRAAHWGDGPLYFVGSREAFPTCWRGAQAFEALLGWPAVARTDAEFSAYSLGALRSRSVVCFVAGEEESEKRLGAARAARARGAFLIAFGGGEGQRMAGLAHALLPASGEWKGRSLWGSCLARHAAVTYLALVAARILRPPEEARRAAEAEFEKLPQELERAQTQLSDALKALGREVRKAGHLGLGGGGLYYPTACEAAREFARAFGVEARAANVAEDVPIESPATGSALVFSNSRCPVKHQAHLWARQVSKAGAALLSLTDPGDREMCEMSRLAVLLPALAEPAGSILELAAAQEAARLAGRERMHPGARSSEEPRAQ